MKKNSQKIFEPGKGKLSSILHFISFLFTKPGFLLLQRITGKALIKAGLRKENSADYTKWIAAHTDPGKLKQQFDTEYPLLKNKPLISIIIPAIKSPRLLSRTIEAINGQLYNHFEVCITCTPPLQAAIKSMVAESSTIKIITAEQCNQLAPCCNAATEMAAGAYTLFLEPGDILTPNCLFEFAKHININADAIIYSDDDITDDAGKLSTPYFKPGWSPDTFLSRNYIGNSFIIKSDLLCQLNGLNENIEGCEYYDLLLRATEITGGAGHIPKVLFHLQSRQLSNTTCTQKVLQDALARRGTPGTVQEQPGYAGAFSIKYTITAPGKVSIIIPTKDQTQLLKTAIDSVIAKTDYQDYEILVLNNNSTTEEFAELMRIYATQYPGKFRCIDASFPFNFSRLINMGVAASWGEYILMLNNDIEITDADWLTQMVSYAQHKHIGAVGAKLLYPDNTIQHAGIVLGNDDAGHVYAHMPKDATGYFNSILFPTNYAALTGACLLCRKEAFNDVGGMDESLAVEYNDLDLCLKLLQRGYYNVYLPVALYHYESATRAHPFRSRQSWQQHEKELGIFKARWQQYMDDDPFYNPNLSKADTDYRLSTT